MNHSETQSDSARREVYFDPDAPDTSMNAGEDCGEDPSEEQFSASLGLPIVSTRPEFVVDSKDSQPDLHPYSEARNEPDEASGEAEEQALEVTEGDSEIEARPESDWRDLVSAKVKKYKSRKPTKERYPSLQLQFDPIVPWKADPSPKASFEQVSSGRCGQFSEPISQSENRAVFQVSTEATARVLEFPRPGTLPFNHNDPNGAATDLVADPVNERPRIIEAPELLPPPPALGGIIIEPAHEPEPERQPGLDMPLQTASISRRLFAAAVDGMFVAAALAIFGYMFLRFNAILPPIRQAAAIGGALGAILWFSYQFAFLNFCGTTLGIRAARLKIAHFDGAPASRKIRRWRVFASALSFVSLALGYAWCFLDEDQLCWHDRITKTHLTRQA